MKLKDLLPIILGTFVGYGILQVSIGLGVMTLILMIIFGGILQAHFNKDKEFFKRELGALRRTLWFHPNNDDIKKFVAIALIITWSIITVGVSFGYAEVTSEYTIITAIIWMFIGRLWGEEASDQVTELD